MATINRHGGDFLGLFGVLVMSERKLVLMSRGTTGHTPSSCTHSSNKETEQVNRIVSELSVSTSEVYGEECPK